MAAGLYDKTILDDGRYKWRGVRDLLNAVDQAGAAFVKSYYEPSCKEVKVCEEELMKLIVIDSGTCMSSELETVSDIAKFFCGAISIGKLDEAFVVDGMENEIRGLFLGLFLGLVSFPSPDTWSEKARHLVSGSGEGGGGEGAGTGGVVCDLIDRFEADCVDYDPSMFFTVICLMATYNTNHEYLNPLILHLIGKPGVKSIIQEATSDYPEVGDNDEGVVFRFNEDGVLVRVDDEEGEDDWSEDNEESEYDDSDEELD